MIAGDNEGQVTQKSEKEHSCSWFALKLCLVSFQWVAMSGAMTSMQIVKGELEKSIDANMDKEVIYILMDDGQLSLPQNRRR